MTQNKKGKFMLLAAILGALLLVALGTVLFNRVGAEYRSLNDADQQLLREFSNIVSKRNGRISGMGLTSHTEPSWR